MIKKLRDICGRKQFRLAVSLMMSVIAVFATLKIINNTGMAHAGIDIGLVLSGLLFVTAASEFFVNIGKPSFRRYAVLTVILVVAYCAAVEYLLVIGDYDIGVAGLLQSKLKNSLLSGVLTLGTVLAGSLIVGRFVLHRKDS